VVQVVKMQCTKESLSIAFNDQIRNRNLEESNHGGAMLWQKINNFVFMWTSTDICDMDIGSEISITPLNLRTTLFFRYWF